MGYTPRQRADLRAWLAEPEQDVHNTTEVFLDVFLALFISLIREEDQ
ncbi:hypothetical protein GCM10027580_19160 [Corynebacterium faecale]